MTTSGPVTRPKIVNGAHPGLRPVACRPTRAMSEHRCFPKKRLSTHTGHFRRVTGGITASVTQLSTQPPWNTGLPFGHISIFNTENATKYQNLATQMKHDQSSYFCRGPDDFCWGPAPVGPTLVTGPTTSSANRKWLTIILFRRQSTWNNGRTVGYSTSPDNVWS